MGWIGSLIIGGIAGWLAGTLLKGGGYGIIANVIIGPWFSASWASQ